MKKFYIRFREYRSFAMIEHGEFCEANTAEEAVETFKSIPGFDFRKITEVFLVVNEDNGPRVWKSLKKKRPTK